METISAKPQEPPKRKNKFQFFLLLGLIVILVLIVIIDVLSFMGKIDFKNKGDTADGSPMATTESNNSRTVSNKPGRTWNDCKVLTKEKDYLPEAFGSFTSDTVEKYEPKGWLGKYINSSSNVGSLEEIPSVSVIVRKDKNPEKYIKDAFQLDNSKLTKNLHGSKAFVGIITINHNNEDVRLTPDNAISVISKVEEHDLIIEMHVFNESEAVFDLWFEAVCKKV